MKSDLFETTLGSRYESKKNSRNLSFLLKSFKSLFISISLGPGVGVKEKPLHSNLILAISNGKLVKSSTLRVVLLSVESFSAGAFNSHC